jgi:hypothetical protein
MEDWWWTAEPLVRHETDIKSPYRTYVLATFSLVKAVQKNFESKNVYFFCPKPQIVPNTFDTEMVQHNDRLPSALEAREQRQICVSKNT